jgi:hypothetical protein
MWELIYLRFNLLQYTSAKCTLITFGKGKGVEQRPKIRHPRKDICNPHRTNPHFPPSTLHLSVAAHSLLCLLGSTQTRENIDVPHWGSHNPCEGRVLEWRLRMYGMYHRSTWTFVCSLSLQRTRRLELTLETYEVGQQRSSSQKQNVIRQNGTGKYTIKSFSFSVPKGRLHRSAWSHKPGKEIYPSHSIGYRDSTHSGCGRSSRVKPDLP